VNPAGGGNFAANVVTGPFDAREFPLVEFDYRVGPGVKTDFFVKVAERWYEIGFTDDPKDLVHRRVNVASIGQIAGIVADDRWHTARFDLYEMLRTKTGNHIVDEIVMADWDVGGFMKLAFGHNRQGATYYVDDFTIRRAPGQSPTPPESAIRLNDFDEGSDGGFSRPWLFTGAPGTGQLTFPGRAETSEAFAFNFDVSQREAFAGYAMSLHGLDLRAHTALSFRVRASSADQDLILGLKDRRGTEAKLRLSAVAPARLGPMWRTVSVPLAAFGDGIHLGALENVSFAVESGLATTGTLYFDNIAFTRTVEHLAVDSFDDEEPLNLLRRPHGTFATGAAAATGSIVAADGHRFYRLSYGGNIGEIKPYGGELFSYAGWMTALGGIDCSRCDAVTFRIRGAKGGEQPHVYLDDGNHRWPVDIAKYAPVTTSWQQVSIPLAAFAEYGVDLTHLSELQIVFEWQPVSGSVYFDDIEFTTRAGQDAGKD